MPDDGTLLKELLRTKGDRGMIKVSKLTVVLLLIMILGLWLIITGCSPEDSLSACEKAFKEAASVSEYQDTHEDMDPAFRNCKTIEEFKKASENYPDALDGTDPETYIRNRCNYAAEELGLTPICEAWDKR